MRTCLLSLVLLIACNGKSDDDSDTDTDPGPSCTPEQDGDGDGFCPPEDCDDTNQNVNPDAPEIPYNERDDDCDGVDVMDVDGDGFNGGPDGDDCMDSNPDVYPGAFEPCYPDLDYNCDGIISPDDCDLDGWVKNEDCDDEDDTVFPGAPDEWYDGVDSNCDYKSDFDADADGDDLEWQDDWPPAEWPEYIAAWDPNEPGKLAYIKKDEAKDTWYDHGQDCDDNEPLVGGRLDELWDGVDRNCDGTIDALHQNDAWMSWNGNAGAGGVGGMLAGDGSFSTATVNLGDLDGDGFPEIAFSDLKAAEYLGRVYVISTGAGSGKAYQKAVSSIDDPDVLGSYTGWDIASAGDLTGDGISELLVGNPFYNAGAGAVLVFDGSDLTSGTSLTLSDSIASLEAGLYAGMGTNRLGDLNDDTVPEVISAGTYYADLDIAIYDGDDVGDGGAFGSGDAESLLSTKRAGGDVIGTTDFDGDGETDVFIASPSVQIWDSTGALVTPDCTTGTGQIYWGDGDDLTGGVIAKTNDLNQLSGAPCVGITMGAAGDLDNDGYAELLIADPSVTALDTLGNGGAIYIIDGDDIADGGDIEDDATWTITSANGSAWLRVSETTGDHNGDGTHDLLVGAPGLFDVFMAAQGIVAPSGESHMYWFDTATLGSGGNFSTADADADFFHQTSGAGFGTSWAVGPMDDADTVDDIVIGSPLQGTGGAFVFLSKF